MCDQNYYNLFKLLLVEHYVKLCIRHSKSIQYDLFKHNFQLMLIHQFCCVFIRSYVIYKFKSFNIMFMFVYFMVIYTLYSVVDYKTNSKRMWNHARLKMVMWSFSANTHIKFDPKKSASSVLVRMSVYFIQIECSSMLYNVVYIYS